ncbi:MAG: DUF86 domain-containing protein [Elusimicrobia bacterium]|nr:DUF86 domain-containing protein [Elusimicrobiota bacterium]
MTLDRERIAQRIESIRRLLQDWEEASRVTTVRNLREDRKTCLFLCYVMESSIQTALDMANHLIANLDMPRPSSYRETFAILGAHGWIRASLAAKLEELAAFRNILAHHYTDLDHAKMLPHVKKSWKTLREFVRVVARKTLRKG